MRGFLSLLAGVSLCVSISATVPAHAQVQPIPDAEFRRLLGDLEAAEFGTRDRAQKDLTDAALQRRLTPTQVEALQRAALTSMNPEIRLRAGSVFDQLVRSLPAYAALYSKVQVQVVQQLLTAPPDPLETARFRFDSATGRYRAGNAPIVTGLQTRWDRARRAIAAGNTVDLQQALVDLRQYVATTLTNADISFLFLDPGAGRPRLTKQDVLQLIDEAIGLVPVFGQQLLNEQINPMPGAAAPIPVPVGSDVRVDLGSSFQLEVERVLAEGALDPFSPDIVNALALPPPGFEFVGHIFDLAASEDLVLEGMVSLAIEYGDIQFIGNRVTDATRLEVVRFIDGRSIVLESFNDLGRHVISASYEVSPISAPFGEFTIIQPVPAPHALTLVGVGGIGIGAALVGARAWRRKRPRSPHA